MEAGTVYLSACEVKVIEVLRDIIGHGFGTIKIHVEETRDFKSRIVVMAGRSYIFFIPKKIMDDNIF